MTSVPVVIPVRSVDSHRLKRMSGELRYALSRMPASDLQKLAGSAVIDFVKAASRRATRILNLARVVTVGTAKELGGAALAGYDGRLGEHLRSRVYAGIDSAEDLTNSATDKTRQLAVALRKNPKEVIPNLFLTALFALVASGGADGDGGLPDMDIPMLGIGAHRSFLTHSFLLGSATEASCLFMVRAVHLTHHYLPPDADPWWNAAHARVEPAIASISNGLSIGIAYHLLVDGLIQPAPYHDLPISMPLEAHQAVMTASGLSELPDTAVRKRVWSEKVQIGVAVVEDKASVAARAIWRAAKTFVKEYKSARMAARASVDGKQDA